MALILDATGPSGVYGTRLLMEAGHRVVRVEPPGGDAVRRQGPFLRGRNDLEHGAFHQFMNAGKESVAVDCATDDGRKLFIDLVAVADAVVSSRPHSIETSHIIETNPRIALIEVEELDNEICGYARSGLMALTGHPGTAPVLVGGQLAYSAVGIYVAVASSACLLAAKTTGTAQNVVVYGERCLEALAEQSVQIYHATGTVTTRRGHRGAVTSVSGAFPCADGFWMISVQSAGPKGWRRLMDWMDDPVLAEDPTLLEEAGRFAKRDFILDRMSQWSGRLTKAQLVAEAQRRSIPASPVSTTDDLIADPQLHARSFFREVEHPMFEAIPFPIGAIGRGRADDPRPAPTLGQHTQAILAELDDDGT